MRFLFQNGNYLTTKNSILNSILFETNTVPYVNVLTNKFVFLMFSKIVRTSATIRECH